MIPESFAELELAAGRSIGATKSSGFCATNEEPALPSVINPSGEALRFNGADYEAKRDNARLAGQILRVFEMMRDERWRTLEEIANATGDPHASISAQLRHLRKERFGGHTVDKRHRGEPAHGLYEYRLIVNEGGAA